MVYGMKQRILSVFTAALILIISNSAFADYYAWRGNGTVKSSPMDVCVALATAAQIWRFERCDIEMNGPTSAVAHVIQSFSYPPYDTYNDTNYYLERIGDSCPSGFEYDNKEAVCKIVSQSDGDLCEDQTGARADNPMVYSKASGGCVVLYEADPPAWCKYMAGATAGSTVKYRVAGQLDQWGEAKAPPAFTDQTNCEMSVVETTECTINVKGEIACNVTAQMTGNIGSKGEKKDIRDSVCNSSNPCPEADAKTTITDNPCPANSTSCVSETTTSKEGKQSCGSTGGAMICISTKPSSNGIEIISKTEMQNLADGSVKTTKTDNATKTVCGDVKVCTISKSTTTTTTTTTKTGSTKTTSTCFGACGSDGKGLSGKGGDGTGEGGDGQPAGTAKESADCAAPPQCDGDAHLCAILRQQALDSCIARSLPTDKEKSDFKTKLDEYQAKQKADTDELDLKVTTLVSDFQMASISLGSGGKCFDDKTYNVQGMSITIPFSQTCGILEWFRYAMIAVGYLIAFRLLNKDL